MALIKQLAGHTLFCTEDEAVKARNTLCQLGAIAGGYTLPTQVATLLLHEFLVDKESYFQQSQSATVNCLQTESREDILCYGRGALEADSAEKVVGVTDTFYVESAENLSVGRAACLVMLSQHNCASPCGCVSSHCKEMDFARKQLQKYGWKEGKNDTSSTTVIVLLILCAQVKGLAKLRVV